MTTPSLLFGFLIATLYGAAFHLWRNGGPGRLFLYILMAWVGFWMGQYLGNLVGLTFASIGPLHLGSASVFSIAVLLVGHWLSLIEMGQS
jgi:hypothetical protein